jgi:hypothetical protein
MSREEIAMKSIALLFGVSILAFAGLGRTSSTARAEVPAAIQPADDDGDDGFACASEGETCLTQGAPKCCRGYRCVGYVCKK